MTALELLQKARENLMTYGWCKDNSYESQTGRACALGAMEATREAEEFLKLAVPYDFRIKHKAAHRPGQQQKMVVAAYNDDPKTTFNDIVALYDDAILIAKEAERK